MRVEEDDLVLGGQVIELAAGVGDLGFELGLGVLAPPVQVSQLGEPTIESCTPQQRRRVHPARCHHARTPSLKGHFSYCGNRHPIVPEEQLLDEASERL